ncbi:hypothetical protein [Streptomyces sp. NPDC001903]|uniref:hypothetical protein n=1 Tax=Streptomyces sp. NPDC001903 TaxID=3364622 RepID=UPI0036D10E81
MKTVGKTTRALALAVVSLLAAAAVPAGQVSAATGRAAECRNIGTSFTDKLIPGQCIGNGANRLEMQYDGNLVLYSGSRACWASGTDGTDGVYAEFSGDWKPDSPYLSLESQFGQLRKYRGKYTGLHKTGNVSINGKGEVWIAYGKLAGC